MATSTGLNLSGKIFFGGLCVGTFGLGCWQTQRYFEKIQLLQQREQDLKKEPLVVTSRQDATAPNFQRRLVEGRFHHDQEMHLGPRGPPPGALATTGPNSGRSEGGMSSGPQGYYVITPFESTKLGKMLLINRGWVPRHFVQRSVPYDKPEGKQQVLAVPGKAEKPRFMVPEHDLRKRHFFWTDMDTMEKVSGIEEGDGVLLVQVRSDNEDESVHFPAQPPLLSVGEYKTTPLIHAGYAATWFGLAGAGIYMTRKLITRGRV